MRLPSIDDPAPQWGDGFEIETLINIRVAANKLKIAEVCSYESSRLHGVSNLNAVTDGLRVLRTIRQEFVYARRDRHVGTRHPATRPQTGAPIGKTEHQVVRPGSEQTFGSAG
jgi:hypothetical protein